MRRGIVQDLQKWSQDKDRTPLILKGARQVGKTYILTEFAKQNFGKLHYFNFEETPSVNKVFEQDLVPRQIIRDLKINYDQLISNKELIFFDEIQSCPKALTSLKYFAEKMPEAYICAAGSLLGVVLSEESFPVGKIQHLYLTPLKFSEFLQAYDPWLYEIFEQVKNEKSASTFHHDKLLDAFKLYSVVGGMPRAVIKAKEYKQNLEELFEAVSQIHADLLRSYHSDFAKHAGKINASTIASIYANIPAQLSKNIDGSTKRYIFKDVLPKKKGFADLSGPIDWLVKAGLVYKVKLINKALHPLESFSSENLFKLYYFDSGLLTKSLNIPYEIAYKGDYGLAKGYFAENVILSQFVEDELSSIYCWEENKSEVEFVKVINNEIVPIEIKSGHKISSKSLSSYINRYSPKHAIRLSQRNFIQSTPPTRDLPLYMAEFTDIFIK